MSWRSVIVSNPAKLSHKDKHLVIRQDEEACIPLEDISVIVVETQQASITSSLLDQLARKTIPLIVCGPSHLPTGLFLSFQQHSRFLKVLKSQMEQTLPFRKNCWQMVVKRKIENQAKCLELLEKKHCNELINISKQVKSGDPDNRESAAASVYFDSYMLNQPTGRQYSKRGSKLWVFHNERSSSKKLGGIRFSSCSWHTSQK